MGRVGVFVADVFCWVKLIEGRKGNAQQWDKREGRYAGVEVIVAKYCPVLRESIGNVEKYNKEAQCQKDNELL